MIYGLFTSGKEGRGNYTTHYHHAIFSCSDNLSTLQRFIVVLQKNFLLIGWNYSYHILSIHVLAPAFFFFFKKMCSLETTALKAVVRLVELNLLHSSMLLTCIKCRALLAGCYWLIWQFERSVVRELKSHKDSCGPFFQATQPFW